MQFVLFFSFEKMNSFVYASHTETTMRQSSLTPSRAFTTWPILCALFLLLAVFLFRLNIFIGSLILLGFMMYGVGSMILYGFLAICYLLYCQYTSKEIQYTIFYAFGPLSVLFFVLLGFFGIFITPWTFTPL